MNPELWLGLLGLLPLVLYIVLVFRNVDILTATAVCVVTGAVLSHQTLISFGAALTDAMGSFLALVGLIIMLGRGLGEVLNATRSRYRVPIIHTIGADTEKGRVRYHASCLAVVVIARHHGRG
jgi:H+/gluconate symporter-like permease